MRETALLTKPIAIRLPLALAGVLACVVVSTTAPLPKFFDDDPHWVETDTEDATGIMAREIDLTIDLATNLFARPGDRTEDVRARNVNTVDEVPDSSWFSNRAGKVPLTVKDVSVGPDRSAGPAAGTWTVVSAKSDGVTPGFTIRDAGKTMWFLKFDPPGYRAMSTGTEVAVTKLMWALGYHVPENHIATLDPKRLTIAPDAHITPANGQRRAMRRDDIVALLGRADRDSDGTYRVIASRALEGTPLGGIAFFGTRPDDPNDVVPHEHRRELRGYGVFAAWLNHVDAKATNALDTLVDDGPRKVVRHHLIDFGSTLGSGGIYPREHWEGFEYMYEGRELLRGLPSFGFRIAPWRTLRFHESNAIGRLPLDNTTFDPSAWKPRVPNAAFLRARADDRFWAASKLLTITDEMLRAAVTAGQFGAPTEEAFLVKALAERRDVILRAYLSAVLPIVEPTLDERGTLTFDNLAVRAGVAPAPTRYRARWAAFDNVTREARSLGESEGTTPSLIAPSATGSPAFLRVEVWAEGGPSAWQTPAHVYFRRTAGSWRLVGLERLPTGN
ncbi:MAG TPA: hypothetical protein VMF13_00875 [Luteitalea sp.]|nr:hypothetical protein [Luteitalea sp.]